MWHREKMESRDHLGVTVKLGKRYVVGFIKFRFLPFYFKCLMHFLEKYSGQGLSHSCPKLTVVGISNQYVQFFNFNIIVYEFSRNFQMYCFTKNPQNIIII